MTVESDKKNRRHAVISKKRPMANFDKTPLTRQRPGTIIDRLGRDWHR